MLAKERYHGHLGSHPPPLTALLLEPLVETKALGLFGQQLGLDPRPIQRIEGQESSYPIFASTFAKKHAAKLAICDEEGQFSLVDVKSMQRLACFTWEDAIFNVQWSHDDTYMAFAAANDTAFITCTESSELLYELSNFHQASVKSCQFRPQSNNIVATAGRDGIIALWDLRLCKATANKPVNVIVGAHRKRTTRSKSVAKHSPEPNSVTCIEFFPLAEHMIVSIGQPDYSIRVWDTRYIWGRQASAASVEQINSPHQSLRSRGTIIAIITIIIRNIIANVYYEPFGHLAFSHLTLDSTASRIFVTSTDNQIYEYLTSNYSDVPVKIYAAEGFGTGSFFVKSSLCPNDRYLISGSRDGHAYVWNVESNATHALKIGGHLDEVTSISWCCTATMFASGGEDGEVQLWSTDRDNYPNSNNPNNTLISVVNNPARQNYPKSCSPTNPHHNPIPTYNHITIDELADLPDRSKSSAAIVNPSKEATKLASPFFISTERKPFTPININNISPIAQTVGSTKSRQQTLLDQTCIFNTKILKSKRTKQ